MDSWQTVNVRWTLARRPAARNRKDRQGPRHSLHFLRHSPMLFTRNPTSHETFCLLTAQDGCSAKDLVFSYVGDLVELQGHLEVQDDLRILQLLPKGIKRP
jgi:hypothetical protein